MTVWHAWRVTPGREFAVQDALIRLGARTAVPSHWVWLRRPGQRARPRRMAVIAGYVFAGWPEGRVPWWPLAGLKDLRGAVTFDRRTPAVVAQSDVERLLALERPLHPPPETRRFRIGERIKIRRGHLAELTGLVQALEGGTVLAAVRMFGREHVVRIDEGAVEAIR